VLIANLIEVLSYPLITVAMATGRIKGYEIVIGIIGLLNIIISYLLLKIGFGFYSVFVLNIIVEIVLLTARLLIIKQLVYYSSKYFIMEVLIPILITTLAASLFSFFLIKFIPDYPYQNVIYFLSVIFITLLSIAIFGLNKSDYNQIKKIFRSRNAKY
jgi:FlaA1/EpsC-like NDP-sugar epimerase